MTTIMQVIEAKVAATKNPDGSRKSSDHRGQTTSRKPGGEPRGVLGRRSSPSTQSRSQMIRADREEDAEDDAVDEEVLRP